MARFGRRLASDGRRLRVAVGPPSSAASPPPTSRGGAVVVAAARSMRRALGALVPGPPRSATAPLARSRSSLVQPPHRAHTDNAVTRAYGRQAVLSAPGSRPGGPLWRTPPARRSSRQPTAAGSSPPAARRPRGCPRGVTDGRPGGGLACSWSGCSWAGRAAVGSRWGAEPLVTDPRCWATAGAALVAGRPWSWPATGRPHRRVGIGMAPAPHWLNSSERTPSGGHRGLVLQH